MFYWVETACSIECINCEWCIPILPQIVFLYVCLRELLSTKVCQVAWFQILFDLNKLLNILSCQQSLRFINYFLCSQIATTLYIIRLYSHFSIIGRVYIKVCLIRNLDIVVKYKYKCGQTICWISQGKFINSGSFLISTFQTETLLAAMEKYTRKNKHNKRLHLKFVSFTFL